MREVVVGMVEDHDQGPHYIPELDPENNAGTPSKAHFFWLLLMLETWLILGIGAIPVSIGVLRDDFPSAIRFGLIIGGIVVSCFLVLLFVRTNKP
jgi:hypothetical protein